MFTAEENELLTRTGPDTPMGRFFRRFWFPAMLSERLPEAGGDPIELKLLDEELVAFRGTDGKVSILGRRCPHRRASLALARVEDCALRCIYHGWKIAADGQVLETPPEPPNSKFAQSVKQPSYPTFEAGGMVWVYMGAPAEKPDLPKWPFVTLPDTHVWSNHFYQPCNYLQGLEGDLDAAHANYLHFSEELQEQQRKAVATRTKFLFDARPDTAMRTFDWGLQTLFRYKQENPEEAIVWIHPMVMPFFTLFDGTSAGEGGLMHCWVPCDDESHFVYSVMWSEDGPITTEEREFIDAAQKYSELDKSTYLSNEWTGAGYRQHREWMRNGKNFSGFDGIHVQDLAVQYSMGPIVDRTEENLAAEDFLVINVRRHLLKLIQDDELAAASVNVDHADIPYGWLETRSDAPLHQVLDLEMSNTRSGS